nr:MAG TPA: hypothetical protein [Caudoviricetes sp.]
MREEISIRLHLLILILRKIMIQIMQDFLVLF